jgi:hypothetical protein
VIPAPDPYRGKYRGYNEETGVKYANEVKETIENAHRKGRKVSIARLSLTRQVLMSRICDEKCSKPWRSSQNYFVFALFCSLHSQQPFETYLAAEKHKIIVKYCQFKYNYH